MPIRGIRGANSVAENTPQAILEATRALLLAIVDANPGLRPEDMASIFFTLTPDLNATYPAFAARQLGWVHVPLLGAQEVAVPEAMPRIVRVLVHWNTERPQEAIRHVYLGRTSRLRPDLARGPEPLSTPIPSLKERLP
ncbi:MAG TPA: chorismate mutase [Anaerolineae bacterium]|nr:chorismate mutase [Anaerolineae bacterium]HID85521.1 chorismate mutase [Anaerolineales bacterium]HIQ09698.1 chorismate mutase [Anaerolineaceae bacterium]